MFKTPYFVSEHAVKAFKKRVSKNESTRVIREIIQNNLQNAIPYDYQKWNGNICPFYLSEYNNVKYYIPVVKETKKTKGELWDVIPTILTSNMKLKTNRVTYGIENTSTALARELGLDRSTVVKYINTGKIRAFKHIKGKWYRICEKEFIRANIYKKPYDKWSRNYTELEIYTILNNKGKSHEYIAKIINRNINSVKIKRCRMRKQGYDV